MRQRSENLGESPCPSAIAGQGGHQDFHETIESQRSPRKAILSRTQKKSALFSLKSKLFKTVEFSATRKTLFKTKTQGGEEE